MKRFAFIIPLLSLFFIFPVSAHAQDLYNFTASNITYDPTTSILNFSISNVQHGPIPWNNTSGGMQIVIYSNNEGQYGGETFYGGQQFSDLSPYCTATHCSVTLYHSGGEFNNPLTPNSDVAIYAEGNGSNGVPAWVSQTFKFGSLSVGVPKITNLNGGTITVRNTLAENGSFTDPDTNATSWTATVDYGDGSGPQPLALSGTNFSFSHTYAATGTYTETVTVTNNLGETGTTFATVTVVPNVIQLAGPSSTQTIPGQPLASNYSFTDPDPGATSWTGTVDYGDGSDPQPLTFNPDNTFSLNHVYSDVGGYTITISITNNFGETGSANEVVSVNAPFTASNVSFDSATNTLTFTSNVDWSTACIKSNCGAKYFMLYDANNGHAYTTLWFPNKCLGNGQCQITISNFDPTTLETSQFYIVNQLFKTLTVGNGSTSRFESQLLPSSIFTTPATANLTGTVFIDANKNGVQDTGEVGYAGVMVSLDNGSTTTTDSNGNYSFPSLSQGSYAETLTLPNGYTATTTNPVTVALSSDTTQNFGMYPNPPSVGTITLNPNPVKINSSLTSSVSFTDPLITPTDTASWNWGDGNTTSGTVTESNGSGTVSNNHTYTSLGSKTITVTITDSFGQSSTSSAVVSVIPTGGLAGGNLSGKDYSGADLSGLNISGANLSNGTFNDVNFSSANLSGANGSHGSYNSSNFTGANLSGGNFSNADFTGSNLTNANLTGANVSHSNFTNANLTGATFTGAAKTGITYSNTVCPNGSNSNSHNNSCVGQGGGL